MHVLGVYGAEQLARAEDVHLATFYRWKQRAPRYREAEGLRRLMGLVIPEVDLID